MTAKDFLNYKKPHFWTALVIILVLILAGVVSVLDKEEPTEPVEAPVEEEVQVEVEEVPEEPEKSDREIILERFQTMDWEEVMENAKGFGEEGWEEGIVLLAELPNEQIFLYGYNDEEYKFRGVAIEHAGNVNYFDWVYVSESCIQPEMYWNAAKNELQVTLNLSDGEEINAEELHVLIEYETAKLDDYVLRSEDYLAEIAERLNGTGITVGSYVDIQLGETIRMKFEPVQTVDGEAVTLKLHQAEISLNAIKDGYTLELGEIGIEPEKRTAAIEIEGEKETYTEIQYLSDEGYSLWYPEGLSAANIHGHEGFLDNAEAAEATVQVLIVPEGDMELDESYLKEAAGNYKSSGEYKKVTVSKVKTLKADDKNVKIKMIEVVYDGSAERFYMVKGEDMALLITVSMPEEALEGWGARVDAMIQTIEFAERSF